MTSLIKNLLMVDAPTGRRRYLITLALLVLATLAVCLASGNQLRYHDERDYVELAIRLAQGQGYVLADGTPTALRPPGYPFLLAPLMALAEAPLLAKLLNVIFLAGFVVVLQRTVAKVTPQTAWMAPLFVLAYPMLVYTAGTAYPQVVCTALFLCIIYLTLHHASLRVLAGAGLLYGVLMLVSPSFQLLAPLFAIAPWTVKPGNWSSRLVRVVVFYVAAACVVAPWVARNAVVMHALIPISSNGGNNLLLGNSAHTTANSGTDVDLREQYAVGDQLDEVAQNRYYQSEALKWMREHPSDALVLYVQKAINYFNYQPNLSNAGERTNWQAVLIAVTYYPLLAIVLIRLAFWRRVPLSRTEVVLTAFYFINGLLAAIFFTRVRFRIPFDGLLMALAAMALGHAGRLWTQGRR